VAILWSSKGGSPDDPGRASSSHRTHGFRESPSGSKAHPGRVGKVGVSGFRKDRGQIYARAPRPGPNRAWREFLTRHATDMWACDFFCVRPALPLSCLVSDHRTCGPRPRCRPSLANPPAPTWRLIARDSRWHRCSRSRPQWPANRAAWRSRRVRWTSLPLRSAEHKALARREARTHLSLNKDCPRQHPAQPISAGKIVANPQVGGWHHPYERRAA
jgi:hypothetical protein